MLNKSQNKTSRISVFGLVAAIFIASVSIVSAGEINLLVDKLIDKNVLTAGEGQEILVLTKENAKKELAKGENESLPAWIQKMSLGGDFRYRYQWEDQRSVVSGVPTTVDRTRERIRFRLKGDAKVNKNMGVAFGIATGNSSDSRSTNQTFDDNFSKKAIWLDYGYVYINLPFSTTLNLGRIPVKNAFWTATDFLWDGDINLDGIAFNYAKGNFFANAGRYNLKEVDNYSSKTAADAYLLNGQVGYKFSGLKSAINYFHYENVYGYNGVTLTSLANSAKTNSNLRHRDFVLSSEYGLTDVLGFKKISLAGEYVVNTAIGGKSADGTVDYNYEKDGYIAALKFSNVEKIAGFGDWEASASFRDLGKEAFVDSYPDSDFYDGKTQVKGFEYVLNFGLTKNTVLGFDYYDATLRNGKNRQQILQMDLNYKF